MLWGSGHKECPHSVYPCSFLNSGQAKLLGDPSHRKLRLWLKVTLCPPVFLSSSHPQVGRENGTVRAWPRIVAVRVRGSLGKTRHLQGGLEARKKGAGSKSMCEGATAAPLGYS